MGIPNVITAIRLIIGPIFWAVYTYHETLGIPFVVLPVVLLAIMGVSELSDILDGWIARYTDQVSDLGKIFDPMADSVARISYFLTFTTGPVSLPVIFVMLIFYRDALVSTLRTICALQGFALAARWTGKLKAVIQAIAALSILIALQCYALELCSHESLATVAITVMSIATGYSVLSGIDYFIAHRRQISKLLKRRPENTHASTPSSPARSSL